MITVPLLERLPWLRHAFTTRHPGLSTVYGDPPALNLGFTSHDDPAHVVANRDLLVSQVAGQMTLLTVRQVHGTALHVADAGAPHPRPAPEADGILTHLPGLLLGILVADCVPILLVDPRQRAVAAVHAGWRGTAAAIIRCAVELMQSSYGSAPDTLLAAIGPAIGACCYLVGDEVRDSFPNDSPDSIFQRHADGLHLNLAEANRRQLLSARLPAAQISVVAECTACTREHGARKFFSHRAEHGVTGRAMAVIGMVDPAAK